VRAFFAAVARTAWRGAGSGGGAAAGKSAAALPLPGAARVAIDAVATEP